MRGQGPARDAAFKLEFPNGLAVLQTRTRPSSKAVADPTIVQNGDGSTAIYWTDMAFYKTKSFKRTFQAKVIVDECAPDVLAVTALAYLVNTTDMTPYCTESLAAPASVHVRYPRTKKAGLGKQALKGHATCAPTPAPTVNPATPFSLYAPGQRGVPSRLAPFEDRRLVDHIRLDEEQDMIRKVPDGTRALQASASIATPSECFSYCSLNGDVSAPFFFSWNTVTSQCFCCSGDCTLILDGSVDTYQAVVDETAVPTSAPTPGQPTAAPMTSAPSSAPTVMPTASPSAEPTTPSPSTSPGNILECVEFEFVNADGMAYVFNNCGPFTTCSEGSIVTPTDSLGSPPRVSCAVACAEGGYFMASFNPSEGSCKCTTKEQYEESGVIFAAGQELYTVVPEERSIQLSEQCSVVPTTSAPSSTPTAMPTASPSAAATSSSPSTSPENILECQEVTYIDVDGEVYVFNECGPFTTCSEGSIFTPTDSLGLPPHVSCAVACTDGGYFISTYSVRERSCKCTTKEQYEESGVIFAGEQILLALTPEGRFIQLSEQCGEASEGAEPEVVAEAV